MSGPAEPAEPALVGRGIREIDTLLGGWRRATAAYLVEGPEPVLIDTGSQSSAPAVIAALTDLGIEADGLAAIVLTHIHLDHAGGVGDLARAFPRATVYAHELGIRHLVDPSRLLDSSARAYGPLLDSLYGRLAPTPRERLAALADGELVNCGAGRHLRCVHTPGHARHHLSLVDSDTGVLFAGEALGIRFPEVGVLRPATPAPDFDLDVALGSIRRLAGHSPSGVALAHYGFVDGAAGLLAEAEPAMLAWVGVAEAAWERGRDLTSALEEAFPEPPSADPEVAAKLEALRGSRANASGLGRWLEQRDGRRPETT